MPNKSQGKEARFLCSYAGTCLSKLRNLRVSLDSGLANHAGLTKTGWYTFVENRLLSNFRIPRQMYIFAQTKRVLTHSINKFSAILLLADGTYFTGTSIGKIGTTTGEVCFNTGMTGYQEVFTDPSYYGQILVETNVHIGNYGVHPGEAESGGIKIAGLVFKTFNV